LNSPAFSANSTGRKKRGFLELLGSIEFVELLGFLEFWRSTGMAADHFGKGSKERMIKEGGIQSYRVGAV
jgi:hypothetical protein